MKYAIPLAILGAILGYLAGAFTAASFNLADWNSVGRGYCAVVMALAGAGGAYIGIELGKKKGTK